MKKLFSNSFWWLIFCISPLLVLIAAILFFRITPFHFIPLWNDEVGWFMQVKSVANFGIPLGFSGYNETHAAVGSFGPWGGAIVYLMAIFAKLFGWHYYSPLFMNVFYMIFANFIFLILTKPNKKITFRLLFLNFVLFVNIQYMFTGMSECTRFSMAVILSGFFCYLFNADNIKKSSYSIVLCITPLLLFLFSNCYIMFSILFPFYGFALFSYWNPKKWRCFNAFLLCILTPVIVTIVCIFILKKTSAPYIHPSPLQYYLSQTNILAFIKIVFNTFADNYKNANLKFIINSTSIDNGCISSYLSFYYLFFLLTLVKLFIHLKKEKRIHPLNLLVTYSLFLFILSFFLLYSTKSSWTYIRCLNVSLVFCLYIVCVIESDRCIQLLLCLILSLFLPFTPVIIRNIDARCKGEGYKDLEKYSEVFSNKMQISKSEDKWDNTYAIYGNVYNFYCTIPAGFCGNTIFNNRPVSKPRYILSDNKTKLSFNGYKKIYADTLFSIYKKVSIEEYKNSLLNGNFNEALTNWYKDGDISLIQDNTGNYIEIVGSKNCQNRIIQSVLTVSGHVYRLSFKFKGDNYGAFAIIRDEDTCGERYLFAEPSKKWKMFFKDFISYKDGYYRLYLSCKGEGKFYYSSVYFSDITD